MTENFTKIPRPEHPNPQFERSRWQNLNGLWDFEFDFGTTGLERKLYENPQFTKQILVPFCPESQLSGIGYTDFIPCCWYHRSFTIHAEDLNDAVYLHFGAVDYEAHVFINGQEAGTHKGGYTSFQVEISALLKEGENDLTVCAIDHPLEGKQPSGKQSDQYYSYGCYYTRTTGIWQTVWLEFAPKAHIKSVRYFPNVAENSVVIEAHVEGTGVFTAEASFEGRPCGKASAKAENGTAFVTIPLSETHLWGPGQGNLYDLTLSFGEDSVKSYFGLRELRLDGYRFLINGVSVFQRLILDQGFYPDGIYTAPTAEALEKDILLSMKAGFNGARLHQKVFEPRFLYYCDKHGYLAWGEMANWGFDISSPTAFEAFIPEWMESIERDFNHPAIVGWCPFNETWDYKGRKQEDGLLRMTYRLTKQYDKTRPCIDTSGNFHVETDIYDLHDYEQNVEEFSSHYDPFGKGEGPFRETHPARQSYTEGLPFFISEYGGIKWAPRAEEGENAWGYGEGPQTEEEFFARYRGLTEALLCNPKMFGFCYTQLTDVEQEQNGVYFYSREPKFDPARFYEINTQKAAIED